MDSLQIINAEETQVAMSPEETMVFVGVMDQIAKADRQLKEAKALKENLSAVLLEQMEKHNLIKLETPEIRINYIASYDKEEFNRKKFRKDNADLYDMYVDIVPVKASVKVKVK